MAQTLSEQILSHAAGREVYAGDVVTVNVDLVMTHDSIAPSVIRILREQLGVERVFDPSRVAMVIDHVSPASTVAVSEQQMKVRRFAREQGITNWFDVGRGIAHQVLVEERLARPGLLIVGSDSHSTGYGAVGAFGTGMGATDVALALATGMTWLRVPETIRVVVRGDTFRPGVETKDLMLYIARKLRADGATYATVEYHGVDFLGVSQRMTLATMAIEVGAKAGIVPPTGAAAASWDVPKWYGLQEGAHYSQTIEIDLAELEPQIALPHHVDNVVDLREVGRVAVDVVYVGTCTNGRADDIRAVAAALRGRRVAPGVRLMVVPASSEVLRAISNDGTLDGLLAAGAVIGTPGCGACIGRHMGVLGPGEVCLFTGNRNFRGRMGSPDANIYLGSPAVAAATAITGYITHPQDIALIPSLSPVDEAGEQKRVRALVGV